MVNVLHDPRPDDWKSLAAKLARQRLRPLEKHLDGVKHLVVLPSSAMAGIPIEILTERYVVSYAPSGTMYAYLKEQRPKFGGGAGELLALGDPVFSAAQFKMAQAKNELGRCMRAAKRKKPYRGRVPRSRRSPSCLRPRASRAASCLAWKRAASSLTNWPRARTWRNIATCTWPRTR